MKQFACAVLVSFIVANCGSPSSTTYDYQHVDTLSVEFANREFKNDYQLDSIAFILLDTEGEIVPEVSKIIFSESAFFVLSKPNSTVYIFDLAGKLTAKINNQGQGPTQYVAIDDFGIRETEGIVEVLDLRGQKISQYTTESGQFLKEIPFDFFTYTFAPLPDGGRIFHNSVIPNGSYSEDKHLNSGIFLTDSLNNVISTHIPLDSAGLTNTRLVTFQNIFRSFERGLLYVPLYSNLIFEVGGVKGVFEPRYRVDFGDKNMPSDFLVNYKGDWRDFPDYLYQHDFAYDLRDVFETPDFVVGRFTSQFKPYRFVYARGTRQATAYPMPLQVNPGFNIEPIAVSGEHFVTAIPYEKLNKLMSIYRSYLNTYELANIRAYHELQVLEQASVAQNPILLLTSFTNKTQ